MVSAAVRADEARRRVEGASELASQLQCCGEGVEFKGRIVVTNPESLLIGDNVHIGENAYFCTRGGLSIGDNTHISRNVTIYTANHDIEGKRLPYDSNYIERPVHIGRNVWIGMNAMICPGAKIEDGAVIGMGTVVSGIVHAGEKFVGAAGRVIGCRDAVHYETHERMECYGGSDGRPIGEPFSDRVGLATAARPPMFVLSAGRSGSHSIASFLSRHPQVQAFHEPRGQLVRLSCQLAHRSISQQQAVDEMKELFSATRISPKIVRVESDQKYFNLGPVISQVLPNAKFVLLIRDARQFVASAEHRGWFSSDDTADKQFAQRWRQFRLRGDLCGSYNVDEWYKSTSFEKCCWYWNYVNSTTLKFFDDHRTENCRVIRTDRIEAESEALFKFLGVDSFDIPVLVTNRGRGGRPSHSSKWSESQWDIFTTICGALMDEWFGEWRK